jgi:flavin reductase (DIM6/NTAB) family NADH-FMN oxidoreductase RutF
LRNIRVFPPARAAEIGTPVVLIGTNNADGIGELVDAPLVEECPVSMEAKLMVADSLARESGIMRGRILKIELKIVRVHLDESIIMDGQPNRVDPDKWRPAGVLLK